MNALDALYARQIPARPGQGSTGYGDASNVDADDAATTGNRQGGFMAALQGHARKQSEPSGQDAVEDAEQPGLGDDSAVDEDEAVSLGRYLADLLKFAEDRGAPSDKTGGDEAQEDEPQLNASTMIGVNKNGSKKSHLMKVDDAAKTDDLDKATIRDQDKQAIEADVLASQSPQLTRSGKPSEHPDADAMTEKTGQAFGATVAAMAQADSPAQSRPSKSTPTAKKGEVENKLTKLDAIQQPSDKSPDSESAKATRAPEAARAFRKDKDDVDVARVQVLDRKTVSGTNMSANGEALGKALMARAESLTGGSQGNEQTSAQASASTSQAAAAGFTRAMAAQPLHTLKLQLNPLSLGEVTAVMKLTGGELSVELKVQTAEAYRQLNDDSSAIAKALRSQGYGIEHISVQHVVTADRGSMQPQPQQPGNGQGQQFQNGQAQTQSGSANAGGEGQQQRSSGNGEYSGEGGHDTAVQNGSGTGVRRSDGVYL